MKWIYFLNHKCEYYSVTFYLKKYKGRMIATIDNTSSWMNDLQEKPYFLITQLENTIKLIPLSQTIENWKKDHHGCKREKNSIYITLSILHQRHDSLDSISVNKGRVKV